MLKQDVQKEKAFSAGGFQGKAKIKKDLGFQKYKEWGRCCGVVD